MGQLSKTHMQKLISKAWIAFSRHAVRYEETSRAFDESVSVERGHRAMGKRFTDGKAAYRLSTLDCARLFVMRNTYEQHAVPTSWIEAAGWRRDMVLCQALREKLIADGRFEQAFPSDAFMAIDYAEDVGSWKETG